ncbi:MAG: type IV toxin-antitoxin system AbiEi family antitoxin domain-containing protein [Lentisphaerae bacterium]|nr:type IV toxin-antitoxin system AbiEi family antitoxin domain-containing protein [Lentisphaerota bacterium]
MNIGNLIARVPAHGVFRTGQILAGQASPTDVRRQLNRWVRSGKVLKLRRGVYALCELYAKASPHPFLVANLLKKASYVSLHSALAHYGMIPEYVPVTTSVTTGRPEEVPTPVGRFQFRHVATHLLNGFVETEVAPGQHVLLATPYKALVDLLYLTPGSDDVAYLRELRITRSMGFDDAMLRLEADRSGSRKVARAVFRLADLWEDL